MEETGNSGASGRPGERRAEVTPGSAGGSPGARRTYRLKLMVMARFLSEVTVLVVLAALPAALCIAGKLAQLPVHGQVLVWSLAAAAVSLLPLYGFMPWAVTADDRGLTTHALLRKRQAQWSDVESIQLRATWNWRRYVVCLKDGELTFPVWLERQKELVEAIRCRLPAGGAARGRPRTYRQDAAGLVLQFVGTVASVAFIAVFWSFYASISASPSLSAGDSLLILAVAVVVTVLLGWRTAVAALAPAAVAVEEEGIVLTSFFRKRTVPWAQVKEVRPSFFLLPEGFMLRTRQGSFLIAESLSGADELVEEISERLANREAS